jgi:hypothetical protein
MNKEPNPLSQEKIPGLQTSARTKNQWNVQMISNFGETQEKGMFIGFQSFSNHLPTN